VIRSAAAVAGLAATTAVLWWLVFPADWSVVPTAGPDTFVSPVVGRRWAVAAAGLAVLAALAGYARGVAVALVGVALPAFVLYCWRSSTAEVIGANLWIVGAVPVALALAAGVAAVAALARRGRRAGRPA
jgi:hypothetical protein